MCAQKVTFPSENPAGEGQGFLFGDASSKKGLIVIHEWWGVNESFKVKAGMMADNGGFLVIIPDVYRGKVTDDREKAGHYMDGLDFPGAIQDVAGAAKYLKSLGCDKVGVNGFCLGGALSFAAAVMIPEVISAAAPFYGTPKPHICDLTKIKIPLQAHFAEFDDIKGFSSPDTFYPLRDKLLAAGCPVEFNVYPAGHAFTNRDNANYDDTLAKQALGKMYSFMQEKLA